MANQLAGLVSGIKKWVALPLAVALGGTGQSAYTNGQILIGNAAGGLTKTTISVVANQTTITNGDGAITIGTVQNINTTSSPTFTGLTLSSTLTNACTAQLCMDFSRSGSGNLEFRLVNGNSANYCAFTLATTYGSDQVNWYKFGPSWTPSGRYQPNQSLIECLIPAGQWASAFPAAGTWVIYTTAGTVLAHLDGSGNWSLGASTHAIAKQEVRATTTQIAASYDANNYFTATVNSSANTTFALTAGSGTPVFTFSNSITMADAKDLAFGTTTGTKIGTGTTQKIGLYGVTPIAQRSGSSQAAVTTTSSTQTTPWGFSTQAQADSIVTLVNELRASLVAIGMIKGSA